MFFVIGIGTKKKELKIFAICCIKANNLDKFEYLIATMMNMFNQNNIIQNKLNNNYTYLHNVVDKVVCRIHLESYVY